MGACYNDMTLDGKLSKDEVIIQFEDKRAEAGYDHGHGGYSGSFYEFSGLVFHNKVFDTCDEAIDYVEEHGAKWGPAVCVRYRYVEPTKRMIAHSEAIRKLNETVWAAGRELTQMQTKMRINNRSTKPAYVTRAENNMRRIKETVLPKIEERQAKIVEIENAEALKANVIRWYLGGSCSS